MALTIMGGLFVATFLTVLFLPALYALWFRRSLHKGLKSAPAQGVGARPYDGAHYAGEGAE
jgi:hypothetical protein